MFNKILFLCLLPLICSCATFKKSQIDDNQIELTDNNLHLLNGTFQNNENEKPVPSEYFWGSYHKMKEYQSVYKKNAPYFITLNVIDKKNIKATIKVNDTVLKSFTIKGKIKNGYFEQNRKMYIIPAVYVNAFYSSKFRIGLLNDKKIITDYREIDFGTVYFFTPYNNSQSYNNLIHERIYSTTK